MKRASKMTEISRKDGGLDNLGLVLIHNGNKSMFDLYVAEGETGNILRVEKLS